MHVLISLSLSFLSFSFYCLYNNLLIATGRTSEWPRLPLDDESRAGRASPPPYLRDGNRIAIRNITYVDYFYAAFYRVLYCHPPRGNPYSFLEPTVPQRRTIGLLLGNSFRPLVRVSNTKTTTETTAYTLAM